MLGALGSQNDAGELLAGGDQLGRAVDLEQFEVVASLAGSVEEDQQRPGVLAVVVFGRVEEVVAVDGELDLGLELAGLERTGVRGGNGAGEDQRQGCGEEDTAQTA